METSRHKVRAEMSDINDLKVAGSPDDLEEIEDLEDLEAEDTDAQNVKGGASDDADPTSKGGNRG